MIALMGRALAVVALMQPNCKVLQGMSPQDWTKYLDYMLGPCVHRLHARDGFGNMSSSPSWSLVLSYDQEIRRKMAKLMSDDSVAIAEALAKAFADPVVKERYFTTPLALSSASSSSSRKRPAEVLDLPRPAHVDIGKFNRGNRARKGDGKAKGKGKDKGDRGSKGAQRQGCAHSTPDGRQICFSFNEKASPCTRSECKFLHVCGRCFADHPLYQCTV